MSQPKKKKKQCILTTHGRKKLNDKLNHKPDGYTDTELSDLSGVHRETIAKIVNNSQSAPVTYSSIEKLFTSLELDLEESDYENPPQNQLVKKGRRVTEVFNDVESDIDQLKIALQELNYRPQKRTFEDAVKTVKPAVTFLIYGKDKYGQKWLVNLLRYKHLPLHPTSVWEYPLTFHNKTDFQTLWDRVIGLFYSQNFKPENITPDIIVEQFFQQWKTQSVILVIYIEHIIDTALNEFISKLWQPLVNRVNAQYPPENKKRLVLFLVSDISSKKKLEKHSLLLKQPDKNDAYKPIDLGEIEHFNEDIIQDWFGIESHNKILLKLYKDEENIEEIVDKISENSATPEDVFTKICNVCNFQWHDIETTLKL